MATDPQLGPHAFHILLALSAGDLHGSGIVRSVLDQTSGALRLWPATLYGALEDLARDGLIRELDGGDHPTGESERRRYYRIGAEGRRVLAAEAQRLAGLASLAQRRLSGAGGDLA